MNMALQQTQVSGIFTLCSDHGANCRCSIYGYWGYIAANAAAFNATAALSAGYKSIIVPEAYCGGQGWAGLGQVPGSLTWILGGASNNPKLFTHEIGHNFGLSHASTPGGGECGNTSDRIFDH